MDNYDRTPGSISQEKTSLTEPLRATGAVMGIIIMLTGLIFAIKMFLLILHAMKHPEAAQSFLDAWTQAIGGKELTLSSPNGRFNFAPLMALMVMGAGAMVLARLSIVLISTGAKTLALTLGDKEAVKKILTHTLGSARKDPEKNTEKKPPEIPSH